MRPRLVITGAAALVIALGLFLVMSLLVSGQQTRRANDRDRFVVDRVEVIPNPPEPERARTQDKKVEPARLPAASAPAIAFDAAATPGALAIAKPNISLSPGLFDAAGSIGALPGTLAGTAAVGDNGGGGTLDGIATIPASSARPRYPRYAAERGIEGWVEVIFVIDPNGRVSNVRILDASPKGVFEDAAVKAMRRWIYQPLVVRGKPVYREATQLFTFGKEDIESLWIYGEN